MNKIKSFNKENLLQLFLEIDVALRRDKRRVEILTLGGVSLIMQGLRERSTIDIDIANVGDAELFRKICSDRGVTVDIVTIVSTIDFSDIEKRCIFDGDYLTVESIGPEDLVQSKLERFRKQDPEDIYSVIEKTNLSYKKFKAIVKNMSSFYIGNPRELWLSAMIVVEEMYPKYKTDFLKTRKDRDS